MISPRLPIATVFAFALTAPAFAGLQYKLPPLPEGMKRVEGQSYVLIHDLSDVEAAEAIVRMDAMAQEYQRRTRDFAGRVQGKMPFILFRHEIDYQNAGGAEGTGGVFTGQVLMAVADKRMSSSTWHRIQHEGFHQFAAASLGTELPRWLNEGLAEYFGEGVYTGDGFVTGGIPPFRVKRVQVSIREKQFKPIDAMLRLSYQEWNGQISETNYDQAWAMVQFLAHADGGKYQKPFAQFVLELSRRRPWQAAWGEACGPADGLEKAWETWWLARLEAPTPEIYAEAAARMLGGYAARAASQKQPMPTIDALLAAIKKHAVSTAPGDALPAGLYDDCFTLTAVLRDAGVTFAIEFPKKGATQWPAAVTATLADGRVIRVTTPTRGVRVLPMVVTTVEKKK